MATFYPSHPPKDIVKAERKVWDALKRLDDSWHVAHSVRWQSKRAGREGDGEADFVLIHPETGIIVIEVKGGDIDVSPNGKWTSTNHEGTWNIKNPFEQAMASKHALIKFIKNLEKPPRRFSISHAVIFPDISYSGNIGMQGPEEIIVHKLHLHDMPGALDRVAKHWGMSCSLSKSEINTIKNLMAPTLSIKRKLADAVHESEQQIIELTERQVFVLNQLRYIRRALITGGAGTGKTILAMEKAKHASRSGFRTLLCCYNAPLASYIKGAIDDDSIKICTFHSLCFSEANASNAQLPSRPNAEWWENESANLLMDCVSKTGNEFDAIVIDEAQDFSLEWISALECLKGSKNNSLMYVFADENQSLYRRSYQHPADFQHFPLDINCRNTKPIAELAARIIGSEALPSIAAGGSPPAFLETSGIGHAIDLTMEISHKLVDEEGLRPEQITVLSNNPKFVESMRTIASDQLAFGEIGSRTGVAETIARFKGLESDAVMLYLCDEGPEKELQAEAVYVGTTRAKSLLFILGSKAIKKKYWL